MTALGTLLKWQGDLDGARACFEGAAGAGHDRALLDLAILLDGFCGDTDAAIESLRRASGSSDLDVAAEGAGQLAQTLSGHGDLAGARAAFQAAIDTGHPEWAPDAMVWLGACLGHHGDHDGAKAAWQRAIAAGHRGHAAAARCRLGDLLLEEGDPAGAQAAWRSVIDAGDPEWAHVAYTDLVNVLRDIGDIDGIRDAYQLAVQSGIPDAPYGLMIIGNVLDQQGDTQGAHAAWRQAIDVGLDEFFAEWVRERLSPPAQASDEPDPAELAALPPQFHPHNMLSTGIEVLTSGLPALPAELNYLMTIPVSYWAASTCGVVVFVKFARAHAARPVPMALTVTYSRTSGEWVPHKSFFGTSFSFDPIADPDHRRDLDGRPMVTGASSRAAGLPPPGVPAATLTGRAAPDVAHIALIQDGHEVRRQLDSHFGAWVICTERPGPFQVAGLDSNGAAGRVGVEPVASAYVSLRDAPPGGGLHQRVLVVTAAHGAVAAHDVKLAPRSHCPVWPGVEDDVSGVVTVGRRGRSHQRREVFQSRADDRGAAEPDVGAEHRFRLVPVTVVDHVRIAGEQLDDLRRVGRGHLAHPAIQVANDSVRHGCPSGAVPGRLRRLIRRERMRQPSGVPVSTSA